MYFFDSKSRNYIVAALKKYQKIHDTVIVAVTKNKPLCTNNKQTNKSG